MIGTQVIGKAEVAQEGLYYSFRCICTPPDRSLYRIFVSDGSYTKDLGMCVPNEDKFSLITRVPKKYLPGQNLSFTLMPNESKESKAIHTPIADNEPFEYLEKIEAAQLQEVDGQTEIVIPAVQDQQDSDPTPEPSHIWEQH